MNDEGACMLREEISEMYKNTLYLDTEVRYWFRIWLWVKEDL